MPRMLQPRAAAACHSYTAIPGLTCLPPIHPRCRWCRRVPPPPAPVPVRPIFLDTALNYVTPPDLSHRLPKKAAAEAQGTFSRLFGGWR